MGSLKRLHAEIVRSHVADSVIAMLLTRQVDLAQGAGRHWDVDNAKVQSHS